MADSLDLNILPIIRQGGQDGVEIPGLYAVTPPRHPGRGRESDSLVLYLTLTGNAPLSGEQYNQILQRLAQAFYKTPGSVTAALRSVAETLNQFLLDRNHRNPGRQGIGILIQAVLRAGAIYLAHSGPAHAFLLTQQETQHFYDPLEESPGLGTSRTPITSFYQAKLNPGDFLVLSPQPPAVWLENPLKLSVRPGLESMRRRLVDQAPPDLSAALIQAQAGTGKLRLVRRKAAYSDMAHPSEPAVQPENVPPLPTASATQPPDQPLITPPPKAVQAIPAPPREPDSSEIPSPTPVEPKVSAQQSPDLGEMSFVQSTRASMPGTAAAPTKSTTPAPKKATPSKKLGNAFRSITTPILAVLAAFLRALSVTLGTVWRGFAGLLKRILPDESLFHLSPTTMIFIAVAVPVVMSTIGGVVYIRRGRAAQHQLYYEKAFQASQQATAQSDPAALRTGWQTTLNYLDKAEFYGETEESTALRKQAQGELDLLDRIIRLDFQPAIVGGLDSTVQVSHIVTNPTDIYLLDSTEGNVLRATFTARGYELDPNFICGPFYGQIIVGPLVDIVALPPGSIENATVMGMDASGNLVFCTPDGKQPLAVQATPPNNTAYGTPKALALDNGDLYILDPQTNGVWYYRDMDHANPPHLFFGDEIPPLQDVTDITVTNGDLYLLHSDGHVTKCTLSEFEGAPTRCEDPLLYSDDRPGRGPGAVIPDALFSQLYYSPPPGPSIYMLDPKNHAIYHMSLRLAFQNQFRPQDDPSDGQSTAFAVSPLISAQRTAFLANGNQVYYASLP